VNTGRFRDEHREPLTERNAAVGIIQSPRHEGVFAMKYKPLALAAAALTAGFLSLGSAQAANVMTGSSTPAGVTTQMQDDNIQQVARRWYRHGGYRHGGYR
jgi:hypothetical protein